VALPLPANSMSNYFLSSTLTSVGGGLLVTTPHWAFDAFCNKGTDVFAILGGRVTDLSEAEGFILVSSLYQDSEIVICYKNLDTVTTSLASPLLPPKDETTGAYLYWEDTVTPGTKIGTSGDKGVDVAHLTIGAHYGHHLQSTSAHTNPEITIFPPDVLWKTLPSPKNLLPQPPEDDVRRYREAVKLRNWV
jgi:hypothetical protein